MQVMVNVQGLIKFVMLEIQINVHVILDFMTTMDLVLQV